MASKPKKSRKESTEEDYDDLIITVKLEGTELESNDINPTDSTTGTPAPIKLEPTEIITESSNVVSSDIGLATSAPIKFEHESIDIEETDIKLSTLTPSDILPAAIVPFCRAPSSVETTIPPPPKISRLLFLEVAPLTISSSSKAGPSNQTSSNTFKVQSNQSIKIQVPSQPGTESKSANEINILDDLILDERDSDIDFDYSSDDMDFDDEESQRDKDHQSWNENSSCMKSNFVFDRQALFKHLPNKPIDIFRRIINEGFLQIIAKATNKCGRKDKNWNHVCIDELLTFFALVLHTGTFGLANLSDYWKVHYLYSLPSFSKFMSRHRFMQIMKYLSCYSGNTTNCDSFHKVHELLDHFYKVMNYFYDPGANLVVPQPLIYNGRLLPKQHIKQMRDKCSRIQVHSLASSTGIVYKLKVTNKAYNRTTLVESLLDENLDCGHSVYISEYYNNITLASRLLSRRTYCTGPLDPLGSSVNSLVKSIKLSGPRSVPEFHSFYQSGLHIIKTRKSFYLSTQHDEERLHMQASHARYEYSSKPKPVAMYDSVMHNDIYKEYDSYYPCRLNSLKWQKKMIIHLLYQGLVNAYHLHNLKNPDSLQTGFYYFRLYVLETLLPNYVPMGKTHALTKSSKTKESTKHGILVKSKELKRYTCHNCKVKKNIKTITLYFCSECEGSPGYCIKCFYEVHSYTVIDQEK